MSVDAHLLTTARLSFMIVARAEPASHRAEANENLRWHKLKSAFNTECDNAGQGQACATRC